MQRFNQILGQLIETQNKLFACEDTEKKKTLLDQISDLKNMIVMHQLYGCSDDIIEKYQRTRKATSKPYVLWQLDFAKVFKEKGGFDIVIGNPPYIQLQKSISDESDIKLGDLYVNQKFETFAKTGDIYCLFYEKGWRLLRKEGILSFITSNKWMRAGYGEKMRSFLTSRTNPIQLIDFAGQKIFESATVDVNILIFSKNKNEGSTKACVAREGCRDNLSVFVQQNNALLGFTGKESWNVLSPLEASIKSKIESIGVPLEKWNIDIFRGILTGLNEAFIISGEKKNELIAADPKSAELIRPILRGRDIKRYSFTDNDLWIINTHNGIKNRNISPIDVNDYPAIKQHLDAYYPKLEKRADKGVTPFNLRNCAYMDDFSKQKIIFQEMVQGPAFCLDNDKHFICLDTGRIIVGEKLEYLLGLLNSKLFFFAIKHFYGGGGLGGSGVRMKHTFFQQFSAYIPSQTEEEYFKKIAKDTISAEISADIDNFFYEKYALSTEEIDFIESDFN